MPPPHREGATLDIDPSVDIFRKNAGVLLADIPGLEVRRESSRDLEFRLHDEKEQTTDINTRKAPPRQGVCD
jgi:hypothetical protein